MLEKNNFLCVQSTIFLLTENYLLVLYFKRNYYFHFKRNYTYRKKSHAPNLVKYIMQTISITWERDVFIFGLTTRNNIFPNIFIQCAH